MCIAAGGVRSAMQTIERFRWQRAFERRHPLDGTTSDSPQQLIGEYRAAGPIHRSRSLPSVR